MRKQKPIWNKDLDHQALNAIIQKKPFFLILCRYCWNHRIRRQKSSWSSLWCDRTASGNM